MVGQVRVPLIESRLQRVVFSPNGDGRQDMARVAFSNELPGHG